MSRNEGITPVDALAHFAAAREAFRSGFAHLDAAEELYRHQLDQWTRTVRDAAKPCPPSELPRSKLGGPLTRVREFLRPALGRPPDPLFDDVVGKLGGPENVRRMLDGSTGGGEELWAWLRRQTKTLQEILQEERTE